MADKDLESIFQLIKVQEVFDRSSGRSVVTRKVCGGGGSSVLMAVFLERQKLCDASCVLQSPSQRPFFAFAQKDSACPRTCLPSIPVSH